VQTETRQDAEAQLHGDAGDREIYLNIAQVYERGRRYRKPRNQRARGSAARQRAKRNGVVQLGAIYERQKLFDRPKSNQKVLAVNPKNAPVLNITATCWVTWNTA